MRAIASHRMDFILSGRSEVESEKKTGTNGRSGLLIQDGGEHSKWLAGDK